MLLQINILKGAGTNRIALMSIDYLINAKFKLFYGNYLHIEIMTN